LSSPVAYAPVAKLSSGVIFKRFNSFQSTLLSPKGQVIKKRIKSILKGKNRNIKAKVVNDFGSL